VRGCGAPGRGVSVFERELGMNLDVQMGTPVRMRRSRGVRSVLILLMLFGIPAMMLGQSAASGLHPYSLQPATPHAVGHPSANTQVWIAMLVLSHERSEAALSRTYSRAFAVHRRTGYQITLISLPPPTRAEPDH